MRKALVLTLVVMVVVTGLPLIMGMSGMAPCPECGPALLAGGGFCTVAVLAAVAVLLVVLLARRLRSFDAVFAHQLHSFVIERPPRLA
ncbi:MAG: hypothetical protein M3396_11420 [Actinomycetota bacterium]|nr:hypothetical protein [Actinomycetota bacterium]MDQ3575848.1 hypothetical protein [Actinomycetota bacterium]